MTDGAGRGRVALRLIVRLFLMAVLASVPGAAIAQDRPSLVIGYLELIDDPRLDEDRVYARIQLRPLGRPYFGASVGIDDAAAVARAIGIDFSLSRHQGADAADLIDTVKSWSDERGVRLFLVDVPGLVLREVLEGTDGMDILLFNVSVPDDDLRGESCRRHLMHTLPGHAMQMDALVQYLVTKGWTDLLVLVGPLAEDADLARALDRAAGRFGAKIVDRRPFLLSNDPRVREQNNVALMTATGRDYDVVVVLDSDGEFSRYVPYAVNRARPVVGTTGLVPAVWHWSFERHGAPQLNGRFERAAGRRMTGQDWAAWVAVKAIVQSALRTRTAEFDAVSEYLRGDRLRVDGAKGPALNFRPWNNQLRQPIFLATANAVIERTPLRGFLHPHNDLDTLGEEAEGTACRF